MRGFILGALVASFFTGVIVSAAGNGAAFFFGFLVGILCGIWIYQMICDLYEEYDDQYWLDENATDEDLGIYRNNADRMKEDDEDEM